MNAIQALGTIEVGENSLTPQIFQVSKVWLYSIHV